MTSWESEMCPTSGNSSSTSSRPQLMGRVGEAVHEQHRDRRAAELSQALHALAHRVLVEGKDDAALEVDPLGDRDARPPPGDRQGSGIGGVPDLLLVHPAHLDLVAVTAGDEEPGVRPLHLDHGVVRDGGAVDEGVDAGAEVGGGQLRPLCEQGDAVHHPDRLVVGCGRGLVEQDLAFGRDADEVGERAADVDPDAVPGRVGHPARRDARSCSVAAASTSSVRSSSEPVSTTP